MKVQKKSEGVNAQTIVERKKIPPTFALLEWNISHSYLMHV